MTPPTSSVLLGARSWEIFSVFVKADCHNAIGSVKGLFNTISMMTIDVDVEYTGI